MATTSWLQELPTEILMDILARLPVNTMVQCKNVCRSWRDMLSTPYFARLHFSKAKPASLLFFCKCSGNKTGQYDCDIHSLSNRNITNAMLSMPTEFDLPKISYKGNFVGSSNGLLCFSETDDRKINKFYICNPITGEYVKIPGPEVEQGQVASIRSVGFYHSSQSNQCKIVINRPCEIDIPAQIFTLGSNSWRKIDIPGLRYRGYCPRAVFVNESLHWITVDKHNRDNQYICSFDMENEQARSIAPPHQIDMKTASLVLLGNFLYLYDNGFPEFNMWLMKEYGFKESWKHYVVERSPNSLYRPIRIEEDGSILLLHGCISKLPRKYSESLCSYDPKDQEINSTISDW